jgi:hypothetical protein
MDNILKLPEEKQNDILLNESEHNSNVEEVKNKKSTSHYVVYIPPYINNKTISYQKDVESNMTRSITSSNSI